MGVKHSPKCFAGLDPKQTRQTKKGWRKGFDFLLGVASMRIHLFESLPCCFCHARWDPSSLVDDAVSLGYLLNQPATSGDEKKTLEAQNSHRVPAAAIGMCISTHACRCHLKESSKLQWMGIQAENPLPLHKSGLFPDTMSSLFAYVKKTDLLLPLLAASLNYLRLFSRCCFLKLLTEKA